VIAGLSQSQLNLWGITLALGLIVAGVVWALLALLHRTVQRIDEAMARVWEAGKLVAANTSTTWMLAQTAELVNQIRDELVAHERLLVRKAGGEA
jgi:hypothetical protein